MKIKLGRLPDARMVKVTILLSSELNTRLERYAQFYTQTWAHEADARGLIPHMLAQFLANDRAFRRHESESDLQVVNKP